MSAFEKGTAVISVDDGSEDNYRLYRLLSRYGIPATFNIVTSWIGTKGYLSLDQLMEIHRDPLMEIACHGHTHQNDDGDIMLGNRHLFAWLGEGDGRIGFASPGSGMHQDYIAANAEKLRRMGLLYVRSSTNYEPNERHRELSASLTEKGVAEEILRNVPRLIYGFSDLFIPSAVVYHHTPVENLKALADLAVEERACLVFMFHRVKKQGEDNWDNTWSYDLDMAEEFLRYLKEKQATGELALMTTREAYEVGVH